MKITVEDIAKLFGVEVGEVFQATGLWHGELKTTKVMVDAEECDVSILNDGAKFPADLRWLLTECEITKLPWRPKSNEDYWYPIPSDERITTTYFVDAHRPDEWRYRHSLCFKTREEAETKHDELYGVAK